MQNLYVLENKIIQNFNRDNKKIEKLNFFIITLINIFLQLPRYRSLFIEDIIALFTCYNPLIFFQDSKSLYEKLLYIYHNSKREYFIENGDHFSLQVCPERRARIGQTHHGRGQRSFGLGLSVYPLAPSYGFATAFTCFK